MTNTTLAILAGNVVLLLLAFGAWALLRAGARAERQSAERTGSRDDSGTSPVVAARPTVADPAPFKAQPFETQPLETQRFETQPFETQPFETQGFETQGFETQPLETQGFETQGFETQHFETQRFETPSFEPPSFEGPRGAPDFPGERPATVSNHASLALQGQGVSDLVSAIAFDLRSAGFGLIEVLSGERRWEAEIHYDRGGPARSAGSSRSRAAGRLRVVFDGSWWLVDLWLPGGNAADYLTKAASEVGYELWATPNGDLSGRRYHHPERDYSASSEVNTTNASAGALVGTVRIRPRGATTRRQVGR